jgi:glutaredoxin
MTGMILYIKKGCPWCVDAEGWLTAQRIPYQAVDVLADHSAFLTMKQASGQTKAPVLVTKEGKVLADFGSEELPAFIKGL